MIFKDPLHWFPDPFFSTALAICVFGVYIIDYALPKALEQRRTGSPIQVGDRCSFWIIQVFGILAVAVAGATRYLNWTVVPSAAQYVGLVLILAGLFVREWAIVKLGRFFSRVVEIEADHQLVTSGPYRWIRHPAYTGMVLIYFGIALALGTWLGSLVTLALMLGATLYRINVEELALLRTFGNQYREYRKRTWRLFPGW